MKKKLLVCAAIFCVGLAAVISCKTDDDDKDTVNAITLNQTEVNLVFGDKDKCKATLIATLDPIDSDVAVTWTSVNKAVATVDKDGVVVALSRGSTSVMAQAGSAFAVATVIVTGVDDGSATVNSIRLNRNNVYMVEGGKLQLRALVDADDDVEDVVWQSSSERTAVVSNNGLVVAFEKGSATISATVPKSNKTANCTVTVVATPDGQQTTETLSLSPEKLDLFVGDQEVIIPILSANATSSVVWESEDESLVSVSDGVITALATTTEPVAITATVIDEDGNILYETDAEGNTTPLLTESVSVTVSEVLEAITLSKTVLTLEAGANEDTSVSYSLVPGGARADVDVKSSDVTVATVELSGKKLKITPLSHGKAIITVTATGGSTPKITTLAVTVKNVTDTE